jgi:hypothetical protein
MPDLSDAAVGRSVRKRSPALREAIVEQERAEIWTADDDTEVSSACVGLGRALDQTTVINHIMTAPQAMDDLRRAVVYIRAARRLKIVEHLAGVEHQDGNPALTLIEADGLLPPEHPEAVEAVDKLTQSLRHLNARKLLKEVFAPRITGLVIKALERQMAGA